MNLDKESNDDKVSDILSKYLNPNRLFKDINTLDPSEVLDVWDLLAEDTVLEEINDLPLALHAALLSKLGSLDLNER